MGRPKKNAGGLSDEHREHLSTLHAALGAILGASVAPAASDAPDLGDGDSTTDAGDLDLDLGDDPAEAAAEPEGPTDDDVRDALKAVMKAKGKDGKKYVAAILKKAGDGADSVSALDKDNYQAVIDLAKKSSK